MSHELNSIPSASEIAGLPILDRKAFLDNLGGDSEMLIMIAQVFAEDIPSLRNNLHTALASSSLSQLREAAHAIKGASSNCCAQKALVLARSIEALAREDRRDAALSLTGSLLHSLDELEQELGTLYRGA